MLQQIRFASNLKELKGLGAEVLCGEHGLIAAFYNGVLWHKAVRIVGADDCIEDIYVDATYIRCQPELANLETVTLQKAA